MPSTRAKRSSGDVVGADLAYAPEGRVTADDCPRVAADLKRALGDAAEGVMSVGLSGSSRSPPIALGTPETLLALRISDGGEAPC